jgi:dihydroxy-acid dehydratase
MTRFGFGKIRGVPSRRRQCYGSARKECAKIGYDDLIVGNKPKHGLADREPLAQGLARGLTNYGDAGFSLYLRRSFAKSMGYSGEMLARPVVGIADSRSGFNNCHRHFPELIDAVKRGVLAAGGLPIEFPTVSLGEVFLNPTSMMFRNLMSIDVEEMVRAQPMDSVVLVGGCDKTVPAQLMGAASADVPAVQLLAGPMMPTSFRGERLGACTDCRRFWAMHRAGMVDAQGIEEVEGNLATTAGTCGVMGTASTMAAIAEALGMALPGSAAIPAVHSDRLRAAEASGRRAVELANDPIRPSQVITGKSIENALRVLLAIGGSTNAIVHLAAIAGRVGVRIDLKKLNTLSDSTPVLVDLKPTGQYYMSDLHAAGGVGAVLRELRPLLNLDCMTVAGETLGERLDAEPAWVDRNVVKPFGEPLAKEGGLVALFGSLAPNGAILKRSAADPKLFEREGRAVVFTSLDDLAARIDDPALDVTAEDFLVLQNAGPKSGYAMPEAGYLPIPAQLARAGVKDMVRISDARMSGTAYGTIVLHVSPEAAAGGPLALVKNGDRIGLSVKARSIDLLVGEEELAKRRAAWKPPVAPPSRGYAKLYMDHVMQAEHGCDFDFLRKA